MNLKQEEKEKKIKEIINSIPMVYNYRPKVKVVLPKIDPLKDLS
jgi:hypothetical protein